MLPLPLQHHSYIIYLLLASRVLTSSPDCAQAWIRPDVGAGSGHTDHLGMCSQELVGLWWMQPEPGATRPQLCSYLDRRPGPQAPGMCRDRSASLPNHQAQGHRLLGDTCLPAHVFPALHLSSF